MYLFLVSIFNNFLSSLSDLGAMNILEKVSQVAR